LSTQVIDWLEIEQVCVELTVDPNQAAEVSPRGIADQQTSEVPEAMETRWPMYPVR
jgi:hypothetical protein